MSPLLQILMEQTECPARTVESLALDKEIVAQQEVISSALSYEFLNHYTTLCNRRHAMEIDSYFEQGFFICAQLFVEILSKYSS